MYLNDTRVIQKQYLLIVFFEHDYRTTYMLYMSTKFMFLYENNVRKFSSNILLNKIRIKLIIFLLYDMHILKIIF